VDRAVAGARQAEARTRLESATAAYYDSLSGRDLKEERRVEDAVANAATQVDFDAE